MPELPEVETIKRSLQWKLKNRSITSCRISETINQSHQKGKKALLKKQTPNEFERFFFDIEISVIERRSKYLLFWLERNNKTFCLVSHLGMTGAWFIVNNINEIEPKYRKHIHATFLLDNGQQLVYSDIRRFGELSILSMDEYNTFSPVQLLGPEPFDEGAYGHFLQTVQLEKNQEKSVKSLIMNQRVLAGVGNIYACECLFYAGIHPNTKAHSLQESNWNTLFHHIISLLSYSISVGGASISDYVDADGKRGSFQNTLQVYHQKQCPKCQAAIQSIEIEKRSSFFCPNCQPIR